MTNTSIQYLPAGVRPTRSPTCRQHQSSAAVPQSSPMAVKQKQIGVWFETVLGTFFLKSAKDSPIHNPKRCGVCVEHEWLIANTGYIWHAIRPQPNLTQFVFKRGAAQIVEEIRLGALVADRYVGVRACEVNGKCSQNRMVVAKKLFACQSQFKNNHIVQDTLNPQNTMP